MRMQRSLASLLLIAVVGMAGCGDATPEEAAATRSPDSAAPSDASPAEEPTEQPSDGATDPPAGARLAPLDGGQPDVRWTPNGFEVRAFGSSSCPPVARAVEVVDPSTVLIDVTPKAGQDCTSDLVGHNSFVPAPGGLDKDRVLRVRLRDQSGPGEPLEVRFLDNTAM